MFDSMLAIPHIKRNAVQTNNKKQKKNKIQNYSLLKTVVRLVLSSYVFVNQKRRIRKKKLTIKKENERPKIEIWREMIEIEKEQI